MPQAIKNKIKLNHKTIHYYNSLLSDKFDQIKDYLNHPAEYEEWYIADLEDQINSIMKKIDIEISKIKDIINKDIK